MTIGEKIQKYRKNLGMSQEELGQKLRVSRQTISLWEKDQTLPTIDNLMRLRDVFGVSVDDILSAEDNKPESPITSGEFYRFHFTKEELTELYRLQRNNFYKKPVLFALVLLILIVFSLGTSAPTFTTGMAFGILFLGAVWHIKGFRAYNKTWKSSMDRICQSIYEYTVFDDHMLVCIYRESEKVREARCFFSDIEKIEILGSWVLFQHTGQSFILRKTELKENSAIYSYMYRNRAKTIVNTIPGKWKAASTVLFVGSLLSIWGALFLVNKVSSMNNLFTENMWLFFLMTPIPISSVILGYILKAKGHPYKKNIIAGLIITAFLCLYGSFTFMF